ncbi:MAG: hypothetical protein OXD33_00330 [Rhodobacteraceae bacterium]|nr:hypothetical protein [Paracoccaceae bacterium]
MVGRGIGYGHAVRATMCAAIREATEKGAQVLIQTMLIRHQSRDVR